MLYEIPNLNKNHGINRDFRFFGFSINRLFDRFNQCSDTASTKYFLNLPATFKNRNLLQIGFKFPVGSTHGKTAVMTKSSCFSTFFAFCHNKGPFTNEC